MDKAVAVIEESHWRRSDSTASGSKSLGSFIHINSIDIDLGNAMEGTVFPAVHEHFSIRGFVAGMRKKDLKACLPFYSEGDSDVSMDILPPLNVPSFRWWQCLSCIPDCANETSTAEMAVEGRRDAGTRSCQDVDREKDDLLSHGIDDKQRENGGTEAINQHDYCTTSDPYGNERHEAAACVKDGLEARDKEGVNPCSDKLEATLVQIWEGRTTPTDVSRLERTAENPSCAVDEPDSSTSGSNRALTALPHRRKPKLRSLADIMVEEKNAPNENLRTKSSSSCGVQATSTEIDADLGPVLQSDCPVNIVPPDLPKGTRSPQRKRRIIIEEDRVPLGMPYSSGAAKRPRVVLDAEWTCNGAEVSESESEGDASVRLDLHLGTKTAQLKPKKNRTSDVCRKSRHTNIDINGGVSVVEYPKVNATCDTDFRKDAGPSENGFATLGYAPCTPGEMGSYFRNFISGQQTERIPNASKNKRPEVEADQESLMAPSRIIPRDSNPKVKVTLDLSLNSFMDSERSSNNQSSSRQPHRGIPDLNETFTHKMNGARGKQFPTFPEKRSLPQHKSLEISASCSKEMAREGNRQLTTSEQQNTENNIEMEIVELLAKNQQERALGNMRARLRPDGTTANSARGTPAAYMDRHPGLINFPVANRSCLNVESGNMETDRNASVNFPPLNNCQLNLSKSDEGQFRVFSSFPPSQPRKQRHSASSSMMLGPRPVVEGMELFWPLRAENVPFRFSIPQKHSYQTNSMQSSFPVPSHKGKTISCARMGEAKNAAHDASVMNEGRLGSGIRPVGSLDHYSNDSIPAMQLLSLMDQGVASGSSFKVGPNSVLDKPFSPCNHHPKIGKESPGFLNGPFFAQGGHSKNFPELRNSVYCSGESSKKASSHGQVQRSAEHGFPSALHVERHGNFVSRPAQSDPALGECRLNRNPAEFSIPDASNEFTISARDLKPRKRKAPKVRKPRLLIVEQKSQRVRKDISGKEHFRK